MKSKNSNLITILIAVVIIIGLVLYFNSSKEKTTLNVSGSSTIEALADEASVYIGIETLKKAAEESKNENSEISEKVLNALEYAGINKENIETSSYNIYPEYDWSNNNQELKGYKTSEDARAKAEATVQGLDSELGRVKQVTVSDYNYYPYQYFLAESGGGIEEARKAADIEIAPRKLEVTANINVVFELN